MTILAIQLFRPNKLLLSWTLLVCSFPSFILSTWPVISIFQSFPESKHFGLLLPCLKSQVSGFQITGTVSLTCLCNLSSRQQTKYSYWRFITSCNSSSYTPLMLSPLIQSNKQCLWLSIRPNTFSHMHFGLTSFYSPHPNHNASFPWTCQIPVIPHCFFSCCFNCLSYYSIINLTLPNYQNYFQILLKCHSLRNDLSYWPTNLNLQIPLVPTPSLSLLDFFSLQSTYTINTPHILLPFVVYYLYPTIST